MFRFPCACLIALPLLFTNLVRGEEVPLPDDAKLLVETMERDLIAIKAKAEEETKLCLERYLGNLQKLQDKYTRNAQLDEAVAIRGRIRALQVGTLNILPAPSNMSAYYDKVGQSFYFEAQGATGGSLYGTDVYTYDSNIATAAVHSGALKYGEKGIIKVTMLPGRSKYESTVRNEITSSTWYAYSASFSVERINPPKAAAGEQTTKKP